MNVSRLQDSLVDYAPSSRSRGVPSPRQTRSTYKKTVPTFQFARLAKTLAGNDGEAKDTKIERAKEDISALGSPCPAQNCIWRMATHYLLEDVQWLNHVINHPSNKSEVTQAKQEVAKLQIDIEKLEAAKHEMQRERAAEQEAAEERISQMRTNNGTLQTKIRSSAQEIAELRLQIEQQKREAELADENMRKFQMERMEESESHRQALDALRLEFENAARTVELLTDDKHRMLSLLSAYKNKKVPRSGKKGSSPPVSPGKDKGINRRPASREKVTPRKSDK